MFYVAVMDDNKVKNVIVVKDENDAPEGAVVIGKENTVGIGYVLDGDKFVPPAVE